MIFFKMNFSDSILNFSTYYHISIRLVHVLNIFPSQLYGKEGLVREEERETVSMRVAHM